VNRALEAERGHIVKGDLGEIPVSGRIAAVVSEPVFKRLAKEPGQIVLRSENSKYPSRYILEVRNFRSGVW